MDDQDYLFDNLMNNSFLVDQIDQFSEIKKLT